MRVLKYFGLIAVVLFAAVYLSGYAFGIAGWAERGWIVAAACSSFGASTLVLMGALGGWNALQWAAQDLRSFVLFAVILLATAPIVRFVFDLAGWDTAGWQFAGAFCGLGAFVWSALPPSLLKRPRLLPKRPSLAAQGEPRDLRKLPQSFLLDCSIRQTPTERQSLTPRGCSPCAR
jgi:hypothetical protein